MDPQLLVVALVFLLVAFAYANVGLGGGLLYFPILGQLYPEWPASTLVALTLLFSILTLVGSAWSHHQHGLVRGRLVLLLALPMATGAFLGARFTLGAGATVIKAVFAGVLLVVAGRMAWKTLRSSGKAGEASGGGPRRLPLACSAGFVGVLSGSIGIGGGAVLVPLLGSLGGLGTRQAIGTASATLLITASAGLCTYLAGHGVEAPWSAVVLLAVASLVGSLAGARLGIARLKGRQVRLLFIAALVFAALWTGLSLL